jgi:hypothetical protein
MRLFVTANSELAHLMKGARIKNPAKNKKASLHLNIFTGSLQTGYHTGFRHGFAKIAG